MYNCSDPLARPGPLTWEIVEWIGQAHSLDGLSIERGQGSNCMGQAYLLEQLSCYIGEGHIFKYHDPVKDTVSLTSVRKGRHISPSIFALDTKIFETFLNLLSLSWKYLDIELSCLSGLETSQHDLILCMISFCSQKGCRILPPPPIYISTQVFDLF